MKAKAFTEDNTMKYYAETILNGFKVSHFEISKQAYADQIFHLRARNWNEEKFHTDYENGTKEDVICFSCSGMVLKLFKTTLA